MTRAFGRLLAAGVSAALSLAAPTAARACMHAVADIDKNLIKDIQFLGDAANVTVEVGPTSTKITGCGTRTYPEPIATYFFKMVGAGAVVNFNVVGTWVGVHKNIQAQCPLGTCTINVGGSGVMTAGSSLIVEVNAMGGKDVVTVAVPAMEGAFLDARANLGPGSDNVIVKLDKPIGPGSSVSIETDLGKEANGFRLTHSGLVDGVVRVNVLGGPSAETLTGSLAGTIGPHGRLYYHADLAAGPDSMDLQVDLSRFAIAAGGEVHVDGYGGLGFDTLKVSRTGSSGAGTINAGLFDVFLNGGTENDTVSVDLGGGGFVLNGTTRVRLDGGAGNDAVNLSLGVRDLSATPKLDVLLYGGPGSDKLTSAIQNNGPGAPENYGPAGKVLLDGGVDPGDNCSSTGIAIVHERNCEV